MSYNFTKTLEALLDHNHIDHEDKRNIDWLINFAQAFSYTGTDGYSFGTSIKDLRYEVEMLKSKLHDIEAKQREELELVENNPAVREAYAHYMDVKILATEGK